MRPHLGNADRTSNYHSPELGITGWPFIYWQSYMQDQWMILSADAIDHFRTENLALLYLAYMEHSSMPEEQYFATVLYNSPMHRNRLIPDSKRLSRSRIEGWIGWEDRILLPPGSKNPSYLFIRPFNSRGTFFMEIKLLEWIKEKHLDPSAEFVCKKEELGSRDECFFELLQPISKNNEIVVFPVNKAMLSIAANLYCSLLRNNMKNNVLFWALDDEAHKLLLKKGHLVYYNPKNPNFPEKFKKDDRKLTEILSYKPTLLLKMVSAGINVWYLDADTVVLHEFSSRSEEYTGGKLSADILLSFEELNRVNPTLPIDELPNIQSGMMFFKGNSRSEAFLKAIIDVMSAHPTMNDQQAITSVIVKNEDIEFTGIGSKSFSENYPDVDLNTRNEPSIKPITNQIMDFLSPGLGNKLHDVRIHFLDQYEFIGGELFFQHSEMIPEDFKAYRIVHASGLENPENLFADKNMWYLDKNGRCAE